MQYSVRVEIHNGQYLSLYTAMEVAGFSRFYTGATTGKRHRAPTGEYWIEASNSSASIIMGIVQNAVLPIDSKAQIVVSGDGTIFFCNCEEEVPNSVGTLLSGLASSTKPATSFPWAETLPHLRSLTGLARELDKK